jgi:glyoxylase-like metal-dependent hydrolase (beta-lactamase superfamily II)
MHSCLHADFVAGHLELRDRVGATVYLGVAAHAAYAFTPLRDGEVLEFGHVRLETISIVVNDLDARDGQPHAVLTGDTLFIGDVGRPDLRAALGWSATELGGMLFDSLHNKLLVLPDQSLVYPAHGAGSLCGGAISKETVSTLGEQWRSNYALQPMTKEALIQVVTADVRTAMSSGSGVGPGRVFDNTVSLTARPQVAMYPFWEQVYNEPCLSRLGRESDCAENPKAVRGQPQRQQGSEGG